MPLAMYVVATRNVAHSIIKSRVSSLARKPCCTGGLTILTARAFRMPLLDGPPPVSQADGRFPPR
ncbi:hypothetical protein M2162_006157 [Streptomyces sp. SAI-041]|nr:hypothetical protein [Streptomyces sp. SAI-041]